MAKTHAQVAQEAIAAFTSSPEFLATVVAAASQLAGTAQVQARQERRIPALVVRMNDEKGRKQWGDVTIAKEQNGTIVPKLGVRKEQLDQLIKDLTEVKNAL